MKIICTAAALGALTLGLSYACCRIGIRVPPRKEEDYFYMPATEQYEPYRELSKRMIRATLDIPYEDVQTVSRDGLRLHAKLYAAVDPKAPVQIMFHGYKSTAERDFCGGLRVAREKGYNVILVDQRAHGKSEGKYLTFGIKERFDCLSWIDFAMLRFGSDAKIVLYGISMGAATVLMAAGENLPDNVKGIVADCGYSSPKGIICSVLRAHHCPAFPIYPLARLGARIFAGFDLEETSAAQAMDKCLTPVLFVHGGDDRFVPCSMSEENYRRCKAENKRILIVPGAGHGMSYMLDKPAYLKNLDEFLTSIGV